MLNTELNPPLRQTDVMLPCPFCGGEPEIKQEGRNGLRLKCKSCLIGIKQKTLRYSLEWLRGKMIEGWNKRVGGHGA